MAVQSMAFAHWNPHWNSVAFGLGAAGAIALSAAGYGQITLALLAGLGAAASVLFAAGQLHLKPDHSADDRMQRLFGALPAAVAVTNSRGLVQWSSEAFLNLVGGLGDNHDLSRLGERHPEAAAAIFRLFAAPLARLTRKSFIFGIPTASILCCSRWRPSWSRENARRSWYGRSKAQKRQFMGTSRNQVSTCSLFQLFRSAKT